MAGGSDHPPVRTQLAVRVQPGAKVTALAGRMADGTLRLKVAAAPEDGRANRAVERLLAETLGVGAAQVTVTRGASSRSKTITIVGLDETEVTTRLDAALRERGANDGE